MGLFGILIRHLAEIQLVYCEWLTSSIKINGKKIWILFHYYPSQKSPSNLIKTQRKQARLGTCARGKLLSPRFPRSSVYRLPQVFKVDHFRRVFSAWDFATDHRQIWTRRGANIGINGASILTSTCHPSVSFLFVEVTALLFSSI